MYYQNGREHKSEEGQEGETLLAAREGRKLAVYIGARSGVPAGDWLLIRWSDSQVATIAPIGAIRGGAVSP